ncbi:MAG: hypothetical protein VW443_04815 [Pseudomonadales bacterium]|jgi:hypothetical protein
MHKWIAVIGSDHGMFIRPCLAENYEEAERILHDECDRPLNREVSAHILWIEEWHDGLRADLLSTLRFCTEQRVTMEDVS